MKIKVLMILTFIMLILFVSCNKHKHQKVRAIELEPPYYIDFDKADFNLSFVSNRKRKEEFNYVGICWNTEPNPTYFPSGYYAPVLTTEVLIEEESGSTSISAQELFANTTYYARGYMKEPDDDINDENDFFYSTQVVFTTTDLQSTPCSTTPNIIDFSGTLKNMYTGVLHGIDVDHSSVEFESSSDLGDFRIIFPHEPYSGIYRTMPKEFFSWAPNSHDIIIKGHILESYNCSYLASADQYVYVRNDGSGNVSISFCDLEFVTEDPCLGNYELTGEVTNY